MKILLRILRMAIRHKYRLLGVYVCLIGGMTASLILPRLFGEAIDTVAIILETGSYSEAAIFGLALSIIAASLIQGVLGFGQTYLAESLGEATVYDIRNSFFDKVQRLSFAFHDKQHTGNLMSRAINDVESMRVFVNIGLILTPHLLTLFVVVAIILVQLDWRLGLISAAFMPVMGVVSVYVRVRLRRIWMSVMEHMGQLSTVLQENLTGIRVVKAFAIEDYEMRKYDEKNSAVRRQMVKAAKWQAANSSIIGYAYFCGMGLTLWYGGALVVRGSMTPGELAQFLFYLGMLIQPIWNIAGIITGISRAIPAGQRLFEIIDTVSPVAEKPAAIEMPRARGHVQFRDVGFSYNSGTAVLQNVTLDAPPGKVIALVGPPGSGKSSIVNLIPRFYDVSSGSVSIDGIDVREPTLESLRRNVGIVQQDVFIFTATIAENIAYGRIDATREEVIAAAKVAQLHDFVLTLPDGYDTELGERGSNLSGGQRQRLSIARAVLLDPPILILDDSTASVDAHTEEMIRKAMELVMQGRTTFVIANRLGTVHRADEILVMSNGQVVEQGKHEELLQRGGLYREIYDLQLRPQEQVMREFDVSSASLQEAH